MLHLPYSKRIRSSGFKMHALKSEIERIQAELQKAVANAQSIADLEQIRIAYLGRQGHIATIMAQLKELNTEDKKTFGPLLNELKKSAEELYEKSKNVLQAQQLQGDILKKKNFDVTAYKKSDVQGSIHIFTKMIEQLENIFISMGYEIASGPEVVTDYYNFQALNIPANHPARELQDTFWLTNPNHLLRTHTSSVQILAMETKSVPLAVFAPGRVYRNEATDATHDFMFMQGEGLFIDKNISMAQSACYCKSFFTRIF